MKLSTQSGVSSVPLVLPTNAQHPFAKLVIRGELGQVLQQWLIQQNKCTIGSAASCAVRCELPGIAPYHALLVIGAKQTFLRALAPKLARSGQIVNELLLTETENQFEIAGHKFELLRGVSTPQRSTTALPSASRLKFTLARPFELNRPRQSADTQAETNKQQNALATGNNAAELNARWIAELIQSAVQPLEHQLLNMIEPLSAVQAELQKNQRQGKLQPKRRRLPKISRQLLNSKQTPTAVQPAIPAPFAQPPIADTDRPIPIAIEVLFAQQAASLDILSDRLADVNSQLSSLERIVADNISSTTENLPAPTPSNQEAIDRLQDTTEQLSQLLRELQSRQTAVEKTDDSWREEIRFQISHLQQTLTQPKPKNEAAAEPQADAQLIASDVPPAQSATAKFGSREAMILGTSPATAPTNVLPVFANAVTRSHMVLPIVAHNEIPRSLQPEVADVQAFAVSPTAPLATTPAVLIPGVLPGFAPLESTPPGVTSPLAELVNQPAELEEELSDVLQGFGVAPLDLRISERESANSLAGLDADLARIQAAPAGRDQAAPAGLNDDVTWIQAAPAGLDQAAPAGLPDDAAWIQAAPAGLDQAAPAGPPDDAAWIQEEVIDSVSLSTSPQQATSRPTVPTPRIDIPQRYESAEQADASQFGFTSGNEFSFSPTDPAEAVSALTSREAASQTHRNLPSITTTDMPHIVTPETNRHWSPEEPPVEMPSEPELEAAIPSQIQPLPAADEANAPLSPQSTATSLPSWWTEDELKNESLSAVSVDEDFGEHSTFQGYQEPSSEFKSLEQVTPSAAYPSAWLVETESESLLENEFAPESAWSTPAPAANDESDDTQLDSQDAQELTSLFHMFGSPEPSIGSTVIDDQQLSTGGDNSQPDAVIASEAQSADQFAWPDAIESSGGELNSENEIDARADNQIFGLAVAESDAADLLAPSSNPLANVDDDVRAAVVPMYKLPEPEPDLEAVVPEPPAPIQASAIAEPEEESIEDYMSRLLARMRSGEESTVTSAARKPANETTQSASELPRTASAAPVLSPAQRTSMPETTRSAQTVTSPFNPEEYIPRALAPEKSKNLAAMRELANTSARSAIQVSARRKYGTALAIKLIIASIGLGVGCILIMINGLNVNIGLIATIASFLVALIWGFDAISTIKPILHAGSAKEIAAAKAKSEAGPTPE